MGLFGFGKKKETAAPAPAQQNAPTVTASQYMSSGHYYRNNKQMQQAAECFRMAAGMNDPDGCYWYGSMLLIGAGVTKNEILACEYFYRAHCAGHAEATKLLNDYVDAVFTDLRTKGMKGYEESVPFLRYGALCGQLQAMTMYGYFMYNGVGFPAPNREEGRMWLQRAADQGFSEAKNILETHCK